MKTGRPMTLKGGAGEGLGQAQTAREPTVQGLDGGVPYYAQYPLRIPHVRGMQPAPRRLLALTACRTVDGVMWQPGLFVMDSARWVID